MKPPVIARVVSIAAALALMAVASTPQSIAAFDMTDCRLILQSFDAEGEPLDTAVGDPGGGEGGTQDDPLFIDYEGTVRYEGDSGDQPVTDASWSVDVFLIPTPIRGTAQNEEQETAVEGEVDVSTALPFRASGLVFVSGQLSGEGGACRGGFWLRLGREPAEAPQTIPFWIALLLILAGAMTLWMARPSLLGPTTYREVR